MVMLVRICFQDLDELYDSLRYPENHQNEFQNHLQWRRPFHLYSASGILRFIDDKQFYGDNLLQEETAKMLQAAEIADFFISLGNAENEDPMTNLRINKLLYFAQGWNLQRFGKPLFDEAIKAWKYGPVVETIFRKYHSYGRNIITECSPSFSLAGFTSDEIQLLLDVYNKYRTFSTSRLVEKSHEGNTPWAKVYEEGENKTIPIELISEYFCNHVPLKSSHVEPRKIEVIGRINPETGRTILPAEEDDGDDAYTDLV